MYPRSLLRMAKWARNPPSAKRVALVLTVIAICLAIFAVEHFFGAPDWMKVERVKRP